MLRLAGDDPRSRRIVTTRGVAWQYTARGVAVSAVGIAVVTAAIFGLKELVPVFALPDLYVLAILPVAVVWGFRLALLAAVASALTFDFLFVPPQYVFTVTAPTSAATLVICCLTAYVASKLANRVRQRTGEAESLTRDVRAAEDQVQRFADEQAALRRVAMMVARGAAPSETFGVVAAEVGRLFGADVAVVFRYEPDRTATVVGLWSVSAVSFPRDARLTVAGVGAAVTVLETGRPTRTERMAGPPESIAGCFAQVGARTGVGAPITVEGGLWGVLIAAATGSGMLPVGSEARIAEFTELAGTAIANADARSALRWVADEQAALRRVATLVARGMPPDRVFDAVTEEVGRLMNADLTSLARYDPDGAVRVLGAWSRNEAPWPFPVGSRVELSGRNVTTLVFQTHRTARVDSYTEDCGVAVAALLATGLRSSVGAPISVEGRLWGVLVVSSTHEEPPPAHTEARLAGFTELVATALANAEARAELTASRARIVATADNTRRRIERDLHDGAQQRLISLALQLRTARATVPPEAGQLGARLDQLTAELTDVVDELREFAHGIHPAILAQGGLRPALKALARRSALPVGLAIRVNRRLPEPIEVAAYYVVSEALTNTIKHAHASAIHIEVDDEGDGGAAMLNICVRDDGRGGADVTRGSGLVGLKDRVEALGGRLQLQTAPGSGTAVRAEIPLVGDAAMAE
jgi:signal transduction histidine kinase